MQETRPSDWNEVFDTWKSLEDNDFWKPHYAKKKFRSWEDWRWPRVQLLGLAKRQWTMEEPENSIETAGCMYVDATTAWRQLYADRMRSTFADLKDIPYLREHTHILEMREHFPEGTQMIVLRHGERSIVFDGHHRATSLAGMPEGMVPPQVRLAVTDYAASEANRFERIFNAPFILRQERMAMNVIGVARSQMRCIFKKIK